MQNRAFARDPEFRSRARLLRRCAVVEVHPLARPVDHGDAELAPAEFMAEERNRGYDIQARAIEVSAESVPRFRSAVVDARGRWMYLAYGTTPQQARAQAAFWIARDAAVVH